MSIIKGYVVPHPPLLIPEIGDGLENDIKITVESYESIAKEIAEIKPKTIIISSPHATVYGDYFHISPGVEAKGDFGRFRHPNIKMEASYDTELRDEIIEKISSLDFPAGTLGEQEKKLDHGTMIPLYFINKYYKNYKIIRIGTSGLSMIQHYRLGKIIRSVISRKHKVIWIASGDLSHKLNDDGPYGYVDEGPEFDQELTKALSEGNFYRLFSMHSDLTEKAAQCGLGSFNMMAGAFDGYLVEPKLYSYEGPFGVGYAIASFTPGHYNDEREFERIYSRRRDRIFQNKRFEEDAYVKLARESLEHYVKNHRKLDLPDDLPKEMLNEKAGVFVSLHLDGHLRGCVGTTSPTTLSIAQEIIENAISSGSRDYRFSKVRPNELSRIEYSVDILKPAEEIQSKADLDIKKYGLIVKSGSKSGLLLPNIEGIESVDHQIGIAKRKAGISEHDEFVMERFEVIRHD